MVRVFLIFGFLVVGLFQGMSRGEMHFADPDRIAITSAGLATSDGSIDCCEKDESAEKHLSFCKADCQALLPDSPLPHQMTLARHRTIHTVSLISVHRHVDLPPPIA